MVQEYQESNNHIRSDLLTGGALAFWLTLAFSAQEGWAARGYDAKSIFLQSEGVSRTLLLWLPVAEPPPGIVPWQVLQASGSTYGTQDAGRAWYQDIGPRLLQRGWTESALERCLFIYETRGEGSVPFCLST